MPQFELPRRLREGCAGCKRSAKLKLCMDCSNAAYCSKQCRREHWPTHKPNCARVHLSLSTFYPVIAWIAELSRLERDDWHPALLHHIDDAPLNPPVDSEILPDGSEACLINFGKLLHKMATTTHPLPKPSAKRIFSKLVNRNPPPERVPSLYRWWHGGPTVQDRAYLRRRISRDGHLLPLLIGTGVALLLELFSTAVSNRTCLHYRGKPIYDFGIYHGSIRVDGYRTLAYFNPIRDDGKKKPERSQDPQNHFWLYFQTEDRKEELFLDLGLFAYGHRTQIVNADYYLSVPDLVAAKRNISILMDVPEEHRKFIDPCTPALFSDKAGLEELYMRGSLLHKKKNKFSMLRNEEFLAGLSEMSVVPPTSADDPSVPRWKFTRKSVDALGKFMLKADKEARTLKDLLWEMNILLQTILNGAKIVKHVLADETWRRFPEPLIDLSRWELDTK